MLTSLIECGPNATFCENTIRRAQQQLKSYRDCLKIELGLVTRANWSDSWQLAHLTGNTCDFNIRKPSLFTWSRAEPCRKASTAPPVPCRWRHHWATCSLTTQQTSAVPSARDHNTNKWNIADAKLELLVADSDDTYTKFCSILHLRRFHITHASSAGTTYVLQPRGGVFFALMCVVTVVHLISGCKMQVCKK